MLHVNVKGKESQYSSTHYILLRLVTKWISDTSPLLRADKWSWMIVILHWKYRRMMSESRVPGEWCIMCSRYLHWLLFYYTFLYISLLLTQYWDRKRNVVSDIEEMVGAEHLFLHLFLISHNTVCSNVGGNVKDGCCGTGRHLHGYIFIQKI